MNNTIRRESARAVRAYLVILAAALAGMAACGSDAPPPETEGHAASDVVTLTEAQMQAVELDTAAAAMRTVTLPIRATAVIEAVPDHTAILAARVDGRVLRVLVNEGDRVRAGALLATVDAPELGQAKATYLAALAEEQVSQEAAARERRLFREQIVSERVWQAAEGTATRARAEREAAEARLHVLGLSDDDLELLRKEQHLSSTVELRAPLAGIVTRRRATVGGAVTPTDSLFILVDPTTVWAQVDVYDTQLPLVAMGQPVTVRVNAYPDRGFTGRVDNIGTVVEPTSRAVKVRVALANPGLQLKPGMFAEVEIEMRGGGGAPVLAVPLEALQRDGQEQIVFVVLEPGRFQRRTVRTAAEGGGWAVIRDGLNAGEVVVTRGAFALKAELRRGELGSDEH
ncbi:MAG: efflux RND transporter periplasmic adaptor subunit [Gemmatimonadales bacterium]